MKQFIVEMDEARPCNNLTYYGLGRHCCDITKHRPICEGDLNSRPEWCPLIEVIRYADGVFLEDVKK